MSFSTSTAATFVFQQLHRRLLLNNQLYQQHAAATPPLISDRDSESEYSDFDGDVVMILSVLLCFGICSLGMNCIVRGTLRCSRLATSETSASSSTSLATRGIPKKALKSFLPYCKLLS